MNLTKIYHCMSWIAIAVSDANHLLDNLDDGFNNLLTGEISVVRAPSKNCEDLFRGEGLPQSIRDLESQIGMKRKNKVVLTGLYIPPPSSISSSHIPIEEPDAIDQILPLNNKRTVLPPFIHFRYLPEIWREEVAVFVNKHRKKKEC